jgi:transposase
LAEAEDEKLRALRDAHALYAHPERVQDALFRSGELFFDPRDLVQVKYEMLRRARQDKQTVTDAAASFGFSRPAFYQAEAAFQSQGLPGLIRQRPGPRRRHKLNPEVVAFLHEVLATEPGLSSRELAERLRARFGLSVHPRSIERALQQRAKGGHPL